MSLVISTTWKDADLSMLQGCLDSKVKQAVSYHKVFIRAFILRLFLKVTKLSRQTACSSLSSLNPNCEQGELQQIKTLHEIREIWDWCRGSVAKHHNQPSLLEGWSGCATLARTAMLLHANTEHFLCYTKVLICFWEQIHEHSF